MTHQQTKDLIELGKFLQETVYTKYSTGHSLMLQTYIKNLFYNTIGYVNIGGEKKNE